MVAVHSGSFDRTVHPLYLAIGPRVSRFGKPVFNTKLLANTIKNMMTSIRLMRQVAKLDTIVSQNLMDFIRKVYTAPLDLYQ